jgi:hypothetical protein
MPETRDQIRLDHRGSGQPRSTKLAAEPVDLVGHPTDLDGASKVVQYQRSAVLTAQIGRDLTSAEE